MSGTVEEMTANMRRYQTALVLTIETTPNCYTDKAEQKAANARRTSSRTAHGPDARDGQTRSSDDGAQARGRPPPACRAYCVDAQKRADAVPHEMLGKTTEDPLFLPHPFRASLTTKIPASICSMDAGFFFMLPSVLRAPALPPPRTAALRRAGRFSYTAFSSSLGS